MRYRLFSALMVWSLFLLQSTKKLSAEETFLLLNGLTNEIILELGPHIDQRISPCSTFKMTLSLMGYDAGVLIDETTPTWDFQEGYDDFIELWKGPQSPKSWMKYSCVWYAKLLALELGLEKIQSYLTLFDYGNQDMSHGLAKPGPLNPSWINSSLKISPREQVHFIQRMLLNKLPISPYAIEMTRALLFKEEFLDGWKLFGKTGLSGSIIREDGKTLEHGWFVGWIEKDQNFFPFAYLIVEKKTNPDQRIPRVKQLLEEKRLAGQF